MSMSRKDYVATAEIINEAIRRNPVVPEGQIDTAFNAVREVAENLATMFKRDNGRFDRTRFLNACGVGDPNGN
jgi:hypothetical protein